MATAATAGSPGDIRFGKAVILVNGCLPLALLFVDLARGELGANPLESILRTTGVMTLIMLAVTLLVTPLRKLTGRNSLIKYRRMLGLLSFLYASVHLLTYSVFDRSLSLAGIVEDVAQRPFIAIGMAAYAMLLPLAVTSTKGWIKRLGGKRWALLHRLVYLIAILGVVHFWMIVKSDVFYPLIFATLMGALLLVRVVISRFRTRK